MPCVTTLKPLGMTPQNQEADLSASKSTAEEFKQESLGLGGEGVYRLASCVCKHRGPLQHQPGMPGSPEQGLSLAFSPRDLEIFLEGSCTGGERSGLEGILARDITYPSSQK